MQHRAPTSTSSPSGMIIVSACSNSGKKSVPELGDVQALQLDLGRHSQQPGLLEQQAGMYPPKNPSGRNASSPIIWPPKEDGTLLIPVG